MDIKQTSALAGSDPLVSVIIPVYGTAPYVSQALDSVLAQTYTRFEIIVVNDGSPDSALLEKVIDPYRDRITYLVQENRGVSGARNTALRAARGEYVAILDSDDYWHAEYLASQLSVLIADPTIDVVFPDALRVTTDGKRNRLISETCPLNGEMSFVRLLAAESQVYGGVTARRESFLRAGCYDENLRSGEDLDLWLRILKRGGRIAYNDRVLAYYREREGSLISNAVPLVTNSLKLLEGLGRKMQLTAEESAVLERQRSKVASHLSRSEAKEAFLAGDRKTAIAKLAAASRHTRSWKVGAAIISLRIAPGLLLRLYRLRERLEKVRSHAPTRVSG